MDQNSNYITIEMTFRLQMVCGARHNICYVRRWIMWTMFIIKLIPALWHTIAPHNTSNVIKPSEQKIEPSNSSRPSPLIERTRPDVNRPKTPKTASTPRPM